MFDELHKNEVFIMYEIFKSLLEERGVTAYQVSKATGISTGSLTDWKKGRSKPKMEKLQKIADYFGVSIDYLCGNEEKDPSPKAEVSDDDIKFALFGGAKVTDAQFEEVKRFARYISENNIKPRD